MSSLAIMVKHTWMADAMGNHVGYAKQESAEVHAH